MMVTSGDTCDRYVCVRACVRACVGLSNAAGTVMEL
jgi:hypothetical protein